MKTSYKLTFGLLLSGFGLTGSAIAQDVPGHPRVNEIQERLANQQKRTNAGVAQGEIGGNQAARDNARDARVASELAHDEALHGGHITKAENRQLNRQLNRNSAAITRQRR